MAREVIDEPGEDVVASVKKPRETKRGFFARFRDFFARIGLFIKQVLAELKKVVTPTRKELVNYTLVVLAFVAVMMGIVYVLDWVFALGVTWVFGTPAG